MKKLICAISLLLTALLFAAGCGNPTDYKLNEKTTFKVLTHLQMYPKEYVNKPLEMDGFTYTVYDTEDNPYLCIVRHCSGGYGCQCGADSIIGFYLDFSQYDGELPEATPIENQSDKDDRDGKVWLHVAGKMTTANRLDCSIWQYETDALGNVVTDAEGNPNKIGTLPFQLYSLTVESYRVLEQDEYSNLSVYLTT